ncbi:MAG: hypothetical protein EZS28_017041 [Streblomastix strix]|uniref:Uncharacterized protein n=1 Tax=Streblomastix strix TaxID=222440 RepID=A0A5J4VYJ9_9EUKA|nr:MAG: hypothetical protein EZS28_017041 [Streblomastix strix]
MRLASGEVIPLTPYMNMIFEVEDLHVSCPATVSRCGMVYLEPSTTVSYQIEIYFWLQTKRIAFYNVRKNVSSVNLTTSKFLLSFFLIHLLAYPYGSIIKGHLFALVIINPFSIERLSAGSPSKFHYLTATQSFSVVAI